MRRLLSILFVSVYTGLCAQIPDSDLWLFKLKTDKKTKVTLLQDPLNITARSGYDNQPCFSEDGRRIYYTSIREDGQADIYYYYVRSKKNVQLTKTQTSEYSPTPTNKGNFLASVVVEKDSAQRIHFIEMLTGMDEKKITIDSVGYFNFLNEDTLIYYKLTAPHSLRYYVLNNGEDRWLADSPVRTFKTINRHQLIYGLKDSTQVIFYVYDFLLHKAREYARYPSLNEDILWHAQLGLLKSEGNKLLRFDEASGKWLVLYDLTGFGIKKITRFHLDAKNKYLVIVNNL